MLDPQPDLLRQGGRCEAESQFEAFMCGLPDCGGLLSSDGVARRRGIGSAPGGYAASFSDTLCFSPLTSCANLGATNLVSLVDSLSGFEEPKQFVKGLKKSRRTFRAIGERHSVDAGAVLNPLGGGRRAVMGWFDMTKGKM